MAMLISDREIPHAIINSLDENNQDVFQEIVNELQPYDLAQQYRFLSLGHQNKFLLYSTDKQITKLIQALEKDEQLAVIQKLGAERTHNILNEMDNDDLASMLHGLDSERVMKLINEMEDKESNVVQGIMKYEPETAGRIMNNRFVWIQKDYTVREAVDKLKQFASLAEYLNYLYVIDEDDRLVGVVSYKELLLAELDDAIKDIMLSRIIKVDAHTDQEEVAKLISRYDFVSIPVVAEGNRLLGVITVDDILDVVIQEANEDIEKLSASGKSIDFKTKPFVAAYRRLPWLTLLLFIGLVSGSIISGFEDTLETVVALTFFMPMIAGMTGNTGTQSLAVVVRGLVSNDLDIKQVFKLIFREFRVGVLIGVTCGLLITVVAYIWQGDWTLGFVIGSSLFFTLIIGTLSGTIIPLILYRFNMDPAVASGPLITTINDILSFLIYFGIATYFFM